MTSHPSNSQHKPRRRAAKQNDPLAAPSDSMPPRAIATSLESIEVVPRTPVTARRGYSHDPRTPDGVNEVELSLLGEEERHAAASDLTLEEEQAYLAQADGQKSMSARDKQAIVLLIILCMFSSGPVPY